MKQQTCTNPMVLAAAACCTKTGKGAFIFGTSGSRLGKRTNIIHSKGRKETKFILK